jgi:hypothetical protein
MRYAYEPVRNVNTPRNSTAFTTAKQVHTVPKTNRRTFPYHLTGGLVKKNSISPGAAGVPRPEDREG